jgi:hypothetical protein
MRLIGRGDLPLKRMASYKLQVIAIIKPTGGCLIDLPALP